MLETQVRSWVRKIPWRRNGNPLQSSRQGNITDRWRLWATVHGAAKESDTTQRLNSNMLIVDMLIFTFQRPQLASPGTSSRFMFVFLGEKRLEWFCSISSGTRIILVSFAKAFLPISPNAQCLVCRTANT